MLVYWWLGRHGLGNTTVLESSHTWTLLWGTPHCFACTVNNSDDVSVDNEENTINANYCGNYLSLQPSKCGVRLLSAQTLSDLPLYQMCWWLLEYMGTCFLADLHDMNIFCLDELFFLSYAKEYFVSAQGISLVSVFIQFCLCGILVVV